MRSIALSLLVLAMVGCASGLPAGDDVPYAKADAADGAADSSAQAVFLDFSFDGELITDTRWSPEQQIQDQLFYTIGLVNGERGVSRLDRVELSDVRVETVSTGRYRILYSAVLPVAFGRRTTLPTEMTLRLPRDITSAGVERFTTAYSHTCVDAGAHDVNSGSFWYYYRPSAPNCRLDPADVIAPIAGITLSDVGTTGRFPEYDMVWTDGSLRVVAVFGKYEDGATTAADAGIAGYNRFLREVRTLFAGRTVTTIPASLPSDPGISVPDVTFRVQLDATHSVEIVALLVDNVRTAGPTFDARFGELSTRADLIVYNGHAGLGANIRALARKGHWAQGQYAIVFMNGCDTYTYVDSALWDAHAAVNPGDPTGTRHLDIVMNAMPAFFSNMPRATLALISGLMSYRAPRTYEQIFANVDRSQVVVVSGEQDNTFTPGGSTPPTPTPAPTPAAWSGMHETATLAQNAERTYQTPTLAAGRYTFTMRGTGDADLYVRIGSAPTTTTYDCRPYRSDANETCQIDLASAAPVHVLVRGYTQSTFDLTGAATPR